MKLVLASASINQKDILNEVIRLVGKPRKNISVAVIIEASAQQDCDIRWLINNLNYLSKTFGGNIYLINMLALNIKDIITRIKKCDIIYCFGGNTEWLKKVFDKTGFSNIIGKILKDKVWIGSSAGSMILGKMPSTAIQDYLYNVIDYQGVNEYLELVNFSIIPHLFSDKMPQDSFKKCKEESKKQNYPVYVLSDNSAVVVDNEKVYLVGKQCYKLYLGKMVEKL